MRETDDQAAEHRVVELRRGSMRIRKTIAADTVRLVWDCSTLVRRMLDQGVHTA